ncbi:hypothetical protein BGZ49_003935 [Haplosporangium sp. Z 27]|nr:hypothetical protein BGZ49_003935 [Haplosporangium sp. Z 27]
MVLRATARATVPFSTCLQCQFLLRRPRATTFWTRSTYTTQTTAPSATYPKSDPSSSSTIMVSADAEIKTAPRKHNPTRPHGFRRKSLKQRQKINSQDPSIPSNIVTILHHVTDLHPGDYRRFLKGPIGERRLSNLTRLHTALQNTENPEAMWEAYQEICKVRKDMMQLSEEVFRLLIIHFKEAANLNSKTTIPLNRMPSYEMWCARIVTVLNDERSVKDYLSRWDVSDLMSVLNRLGRHEESLQEFERLINSGVRYDPILLNHAVRAWGGLGQLEKAVNTIRDAKLKDGVKASDYTLGYLVQQYLLAGEKEKAVHFWQELTEDDSLESIDIVNGILRACVRVQESNFAQNIYDALPGLRIESNLESLNLMLSLAVADIQYSEERSEFLLAIQHKIAASDKQVFDKSMLSSILINFSKKGDAEGAILVHRLMIKHGFQPGIEEHNDILHCYARLQQSDKAIDWFQFMRRSGIQPNLSTYMLLMHSFTRQRMPRETEALFRQLLIDGISPNLVICNHLLLAYEQAKMNRRCLQLYKTMFHDRSIGLDQFSFSSMFNAVFHNDRALLEGGEGLGGQGSSVYDPEFLRKIGEPVHHSSSSNSVGQKSLSIGNEERQNISSHAPPTPPALQQYQYEYATSSTESLSARTLFRDMIIVGIRPSRSLYSNILRAFLAQDDFAGATVALRALVDHFVLRPTPKMNAIVVTWVCQELEKRGIDNNNPLSKSELSRLVNMMERTRGLIEMLERVVDGELDGTKTIAGKTNSKEPSISGQRLREDIIAKAKMEMGGDLVDLYSKSVLAGSSWSTKEDNQAMIDLKDFERWYRAYSSRITSAQNANA